MNHRLLAATFVALLALIATGCAGGANKPSQVTSATEPADQAKQATVAPTAQTKGATEAAPTTLPEATTAPESTEVVPSESPTEEGGIDQAEATLVPPQLPVDIPLMAGAQDTELSEGMVTFTVARLPEEVSQYYQQAMAAQGWKATPAKDPAETTYTKGERTAALSITTDDGGSLVLILWY